MEYPTLVGKFIDFSEGFKAEKASRSDVGAFIFVDAFFCDINLSPLSMRSQDALCSKRRSSFFGKDIMRFSNVCIIFRVCMWNGLVLNMWLHF